MLHSTQISLQGWMQLHVLIARTAECTAMRPSNERQRALYKSMPLLLMMQRMWMIVAVPAVRSHTTISFDGRRCALAESMHSFNEVTR